jgi:hypothetical protein
MPTLRSLSNRPYRATQIKGKELLQNEPFFNRTASSMGRSVSYVGRAFDYGTL